MEEAQKATAIALSDSYAASAFKEGVLKGRQEALLVLIMVVEEGSHGVTLPLINEFSHRLLERPLPLFHHNW